MRTDGTLIAVPHVASGVAPLRQAVPHASVADPLAALNATSRRIDDPRRRSTAAENKRLVRRWRRSVAAALALALTLSTATGCCLATPQVRDGHAAVGDVEAVQTIPILVTLAAEEGEALAAARMRVLARLRRAMSAEAFAAVRTYEALPLVALAATPEIVAVLLTLPDVRSVEADRAFEPL